jgi:hypothetical protein
MSLRVLAGPVAQMVKNPTTMFLAISVTSIISSDKLTTPDKFG